MWKTCIAMDAIGFLGSCLAASLPAQEGVAERIGEQIDATARKLGGGLRQGWAEARQTINTLGVRGRVHGRLYWDKDLNESVIDIDVRDGGAVVLKGSVPDAAAKAKAEQLTLDTVGVNDVINELAIAPTSGVE